MFLPLSSASGGVPKAFSSDYYLRKSSVEIGAYPVFSHVDEGHRCWRSTQKEEVHRVAISPFAIGQPRIKIKPDKNPKQG